MVTDQHKDPGEESSGSQGNIVKHLSAVDVGAVPNGVEMGPSPFTVAQRQALRQGN